MTTKISYAQNFEDVMLHRALGEQDAGFYIDVGAHDPTEYSVTRFFYDRGWHGINVEPVVQYHAALRRERPRDINLNVAAGAAPGTRPLFVVADTGLSTFIEEYATAAAERGFQVARAEVPVRTLDEIVGEIGPPVVHFLKIDVEGAEVDVLRGIGFERFRPWIVLVEATRPGTQDLACQAWEPWITGHGYSFVYFDGLNRFYVASERSELKAAFSSPPNVFDGFVGARQFALESRAVAQEQAITALRADHDAAVAAVGASQAEADHHRMRADGIDARLQATAAALATSVERLAQESARFEAAQAATTAAVATLEGELREARAAGERQAASRDRVARELQAALARIAALEQENRMTLATLQAVYGSRSWRVTSPLRAVMRWARTTHP